MFKIIWLRGLKRVKILLRLKCFNISLNLYLSIHRILLKFINKNAKIMKNLNNISKNVIVAKLNFLFYFGSHKK